MSERRAQDYLNDILEGMERIEEYISGLTRDQFMQDRKTIDAVVRNLEIIGEATKCLPSSLRDRHPQIPWKALAGVRDKMIHHYFGLNYDIIWTISSDQLPGLLPLVREVVGKIDE
jgi:uncharacterized protein with HEPN domain